MWTQKHRRIPHEDTNRENTRWREDRDWNYAAVRQGQPRITSQHQKIKERYRHGTNSALDPSETAWPCRHLEFGLLASRTVRINFCCLKPSQFVVICEGSSRKLIAPLTIFESASLPAVSKLILLTVLFLLSIRKNK